MSFTLALLLSFVIALLGSGISLFSDTKSDEKSGIMFILTPIYWIIGVLILWQSGPTTAYPLLGWYVGMLIVWWVITTVVVFAVNEDWSNIAFFPIVLFLIVTFTGMSGWKMFNADRYSSLIGEFDTKNQVHWSKDVQPLDPTHLRLTPPEVAYYLAKTSLTSDGNTLGSQFPLSKEYITLQKTSDGDYFYLIPLDFSGFKVWTKADYVPGYVKISAVDPNAKPILVTNKKMKYTPDAYWSYNLNRKLFNKYHNKILKDYSFEINDDGDVYYVITTLEPTIAYGGLVPDGVILFDPETGEDTWVSVEELNTKPEYAWIDRMMPEDVAKEYVNYWGNLKDGWWNWFWTKINVLQGESPTLNYSADGKCVFVIPVTSDNDNDETMTGLMYCDARTGEFTYYTTSGGSTEYDIVDAVNAAIKYKEWHASNQIVYDNVYGQLSALVPVLGQTGTYQGLAIVRVENRKVVFGETPQDALIEYQKMSMGLGSQISLDNTIKFNEYEGVVKRIGWEISNNGKQYYLYFDSFTNSFMVTSNVQSELSLTKEGDYVKIKYIDSDQASVPATYFKNLTLNLEGSKEEQSVTNQMIERKEKEELKKDVKDFKENLKNMNDEEIEELLKSKK